MPQEIVLYVWSRFKSSLTAMKKMKSYFVGGYAHYNYINILARYIILYFYCEYVLRTYDNIIAVVSSEKIFKLT